MRFSPIGRESQAHYFRCLRNQKMSSHAHQNQNGGRQTRCNNDVVIRTWYNQISDSIPNLFRSSNTMAHIWIAYFPTSGWLVNQRWLPLTGSTYAMSYISACVWDSNEIQTATLTFSGSRNTVELLQTPYDVGVTGKSEMAAINRKYICNVLYLSLYMR